MQKQFPRSAPVMALKGRGAQSQIPGRFEIQIIEAVEIEGWQDDDDLPVFKTQVYPETAKSILSFNQSPDLPFSVSLNPYRGCEHGCIYCYARPSHAYLGLSPGLDFETQLYAKTNAPQLLRQALAHKNYQPKAIAVGMNTDAYQPCEKHYKITRKVLEVLHECQHPVGVITKAALIERDIDILADMSARGLATVAITLTTLDHNIARTLEPRAASPTRRLQIIRRLTAAGIPVHVSVAPLIPFVTEEALEQVLTAAAEAGAVAANYTVLRLPWEVNPLFQDWLAAHFPDRAERVMNRVRDLHGGNDYKADFATRMKGEGLWADVIAQRFKGACRRLGLNQRRWLEIDTTQFKKPQSVPAKAKGHRDQLDLFS
jgi:DNA repair photolyase